MVCFGILLLPQELLGADQLASYYLDRASFSALLRAKEEPSKAKKATVSFVVKLSS